MRRLETNALSIMEAMAEALYALTDNDNYPVITAYGKYEVIKELLEEFLADGFEISGDICLETPDSIGYDKEIANINGYLYGVRIIYGPYEYVVEEF